MQFNESFWVAVATILFIVFIFKYIKGLLDSFFINRAKSIHNRLDEVVALKEEAEKLLQEQISLHKNAGQEAQKLLESATQEIVYLQQSTENNIKEKLALKKASVISRIHTNETKLLTKLRMRALQLAISSSIAVLDQKDFAQVSNKLLQDALESAADQCSVLN